MMNRGEGRGGQEAGRQCEAEVAEEEVAEAGLESRLIDALIG
jgi:hypothetical protein